METVRLGRTNIVVNRNGFGALPVQRVNMEKAKVILKKAYDNGITFLILLGLIVIVKKRLVRLLVRYAKKFIFQQKRWQRQ